MKSNVLVADGLVWLSDEPVEQRVAQGNHGFAHEAGICFGTNRTPSNHPHSVDLTPVQNVLVLDVDFIRAYYGSATR